MKRNVTIAAILAGCLVAPQLTLAGESIKDKYQATAQRIIDATMAGNDSWSKMRVLCLEIGHRLSGSAHLKRAIDWAESEFFVDQQERVRQDAVRVPYWVRGRESASLTKPRAKQLSMLGLGGSIASDRGGTFGDVVVVANEAELAALGSKVDRKIVLFNNPMPEYDPIKGAGYGETVRFRSNGAVLAADLGAVAVFVRSVTANSLRSPHTGSLHYDPLVKQIPAAAISTEDADLIVGLLDMGLPVSAVLRMSAKTYDPRKSANVIAEFRGSTNPEEIVVIGGHIDSWDVGQGAHDDATGCVMAMEALNVLRKLNLRPRRTIRVVLFTNEENGLEGAKDYARRYASELKNHVAAIESDSGGFAPTGYTIECKDEDRQAIAIKQMQEIMGLMGSLGSLEAKAGHGGADISPMKESGVILMGHRVDGRKYFDYHHSEADTLDKVDPTELSQNVAAMAVAAYVLADMPTKLGER